MKISGLEFPHILVLVWVVVFIWLGIDPVNRDVWVVEMAPLVVVVAVLAATYGQFRFSDTAYVLMAIWLFLHTVGGHYTFEHVPFGFINDLFGWERNQFDRVGHFSIGFYAYPMMEWLRRKNFAGMVQASFMGLFFIMSIAALYEIIEWWYAAAEGGADGLAFLGSQGDIWDAQKDMLMDTLGAMSAVALFWIIRPDQKKSA